MNFGSFTITPFFFAILSISEIFSQNTFKGLLKTKSSTKVNFVEIRSGSNDFIANPDSTGKFTVQYNDPSFLIFGFYNNEKIFGYYCRENVITDTIYEGTSDSAIISITSVTNGTISGGSQMLSIKITDDDALPSFLLQQQRLQPLYLQGHDVCKGFI